MARRYERVLAALCGAEGGALTVDGMEVLSEAERARLVGEWSGAGGCAGRGAETMGGLCLAQGAERGDAVAVVGDAVAGAGREHVSYGWLVGRGRRVAGYLRGLGAGRGARVGVCVGRGVRLAETLVGVVLGGGAYVPLDAEYPVERLGWMLEDAQVSVVVAQREWAERLPAAFWGAVVEVGARGAGAPWAQWRPVGRGEIGRVGGAGLAYVSYTSGSTGTPKGVGVTQGGDGGGGAGEQGYARLDAGARVLHHSALAFDASTFEVWGAWLNGGCV